MYNIRHFPSATRWADLILQVTDICCISFAYETVWHYHPFSLSDFLAPHLATVRPPPMHHTHPLHSRLTQVRCPLHPSPSWALSSVLCTSTAMVTISLFTLIDCLVSWVFLLRKVFFKFKIDMPLAYRIEVVFGHFHVNHLYYVWQQLLFSKSCCHLFQDNWRTLRIPYVQHQINKEQKMLTSQINIRPVKLF